MYALMADLHLHAWSAFASTNADGVNNRLQGLLNEIDRCASELAAAGGTHVFMAGDVFHVRGSVNPVVLNSLKDCLAECHRKYGVHFVVIPGNHDLAGRDSERLGSAVTALECGYVTVTADILEINSADLYGDAKVAGGMILIPWHENIEALKEAILGMVKEIEEAGANPNAYDLILHAPIDGVIEGLPAHGLTPEWLGATGFRRVFSGHYHNHKVFPVGAHTRTEVISIGALAHHTWSDVGTRAGYLLVGLNDVTWRKSHLPQFVDLAQLARVDPEDVPLLVDGNFVRVRVEADKAKDVEVARQDLLDMGAKAVLVQATPKAVERAGATAPAGTPASVSLEASVSDFIKAMALAANAAAVFTATMDVLASTDALGD